MKSLKDVIMKYCDKHEKLCIFFLIFIVYTINFRSISSGDTVPAALLPFNILENHSLYLDRFAQIYFLDRVPSFFVHINGHLLSAYPIVVPVLITPLYIIPYIFLKLGHYPIEVSSNGFLLIIAIMEKSASSIIATVSTIFIFLSLKELVSKKSALLGTIIFAFGTNTWVVSSQALWQHGMSELLLSIMIYFVIINEMKEDNNNIVYLGIASGLFLFNRPSDCLLLFPILIYILIKFKIFHYLYSLFFVSTPFLFYNFYFFRYMTGGYHRLVNNLDIGSGYSSNMIGLIGLLISPSRGLFVYSPILIISIFGYLNISKITNKKIRMFLFIFGIFIMLDVLLYSSFGSWWGGWTYGPRYLTGILPIFAIYMGLYLDNYKSFDKFDKKKIFSISLILILVIWSIFVQIVGTFYYPSGNWDGDKNIDLYPERLWDWKDTQIMRTFNAGIIVHNPLNDLHIIWKFRKYKDIISNGMITTGWYTVEDWNSIPTRWIINNGTIKIDRVDRKNTKLNFNVISYYKSRTLEVYINDEIVSKNKISHQNITILEVNIREIENEIRFYTPEGCQTPLDIPGLNSKDSRCISLAFQNIRLT